MYIKYVSTAAGWFLIPYWARVSFFCHVVFLNFSDLGPHCLLNGQHRSQLVSLITSHAGLHIELHVVVSNVYHFILLY